MADLGGRWRHSGGVAGEAAWQDKARGSVMIWLLMIATGLFTFATRFIMFSGLGRASLPSWLVDALNYVPIAVLTAIIVPAVLIDPASTTIAIVDNPRLYAALVAIAVALWTRQVVLTIVAGLGMLWLLQWLL
jgi:branched-subunit amino acid transport protein